ncbi:L-serine dehydratase, iron-sulfur-dependent subunit alpha [Vulcanibacillus modesticaldus]|uniref:L-serine dehydratase n=1 Tax=Vulcanibacillus modesticaldus TaxID=337097 RepID=A0A1D2YXG2_9BACI|nr:L-serine ammonia-lyase, iron-sulfur-dependent, subunit alpha [Vulcanibacillus modesticaldus]OEG00343.1 L-serine dehydratase, iron-sulfur-dependent subunit alpha [Vulcanibacillus modesticaldus]
MKFNSIADLIELTVKEGKKISEIMIESEMETHNLSREEVIDGMRKSLYVMKDAIKTGLTEDIKSRSGLSGGDGKKLFQYLKSGKFLSGTTILEAVCKAVATSEVNAAMGIIVATPTAGSVGILPGAIFATADKLNSSENDMINALFTAGAIGLVIANNAFISGAAGGCQAEVGSATAMAAAAVVEMAGGTPEQSANALGIALKNMLGLTCDPVAGLVEVPCVKRNAMGAANAMIAADMALAGISSVIPADEVIDAMYKVGCALPISLKETAMGGLADTPTARKLEKEIFGKPLKL